MEKDLVLVVGASGVVGSEVVRLLKAQGLEVRTTTSKPSQDPSQVHVNLTTGEGIHAAFTGVSKAFILSPSGYADQHRILAPMIQEAKRRGLKKVVLMSALGANASDTTPLRKAEIELEKSGLTYNIIRPNWFMQNFNSFWVQGIQAARKIQLPAGTAATSFIDTRDIAAVAAKLLTTSQFDNQAFDLTGPEALTHAQVAKAVSEAIGKEVTYENIEPSILHAGLVSAGVPRDYTDFLILIFGFLKEGYNARLESNVQKILGRAPSSFAQYAKDYKQAWV